MATHRIPILGHATMPDNTGNVVLQPWANVAPNHLYPFLVWTFKRAGGANYILGGLFDVPVNFSGATIDPKIVLHWTSAITSGNVVWNPFVNPIGGNNAESLDPGAYLTNTQAIAAAPGVAFRKMETSCAFSRTFFAANDLVEFLILSEQASGSYTLNGDVYLLGASFEYSDI